MGLKDLFFEKVEDGEFVPELAVTKPNISTTEVPTEPTDVPTVNFEGEAEEFITNAYCSFGLDSVTPNIFTVEDYISALPQTLSMDSVKESLSKLFSVANISSEQLHKDGEARIEALKSSFQDYMNTSTDDCMKHEATIRELEEQIERCKEEIARINESKFQITQNMARECKKIESLMTYVSQ